MGKNRVVETVMDDYAPTSEDIFSANFDSAVRNPQDESSRVSAVAELFYAAGDNEMGDALRNFNVVTDFDEDGDNVSDAREELMKVLRVRKIQKADQYVNRMSDEDVINLIGKDREVIIPDGIDYYMTEYNAGSFYDPKIFGGSGVLPEYKDGKAERAEFGRNMGYIRLPFYCIHPSDKMLIGTLLDISTRDVDKISKCLLYVVSEDYKGWKKGQIIKPGDTNSDKNIPVFIGGDGLRFLLEELHYPAHPENLCFKILPVLSPVLRPTAFDTDRLMACYTPIEHLYESIMYKVSALKRMIELNSKLEKGVPTLIISMDAHKLQDAVSELYVQDKTDKRDFSTAWSLVWKKGRSGYETKRQLAVLYRNRFTGYKPNETKSGSIQHLDVFPQTVKVKNENMKEYSFRDIAENNDDCIENQYDECITEENADKEELARAEKAAALYEKMKEMQKKFREDAFKAEREKEEFVVIEDEETGLYIKA